ncbi:isopenicillin N synthase family dioxygenase [Paraliomyxa miuraensis]|uniref:isopenicillin N synthase family dioxygenase n=1 Tax=Paraliomyxa miuraensis TaxID=376150 RepID=UPI0022533C45|nr:2-oxoglutarate and iron-dependent oxygenase domain-containing protein [Paraliomyxa miuraensis]
MSFHDFVAGGEARERFVTALGRALEQLGFVFVRDHGIDEALLARAYALAERLFALPEALKRRYETPQDGRQRGYTSFGVEHAKDRSVADLKELWHVGRLLPVDHPRTQSGAIPRNRYVEELPGFSETAQALFDAMDRFAMGLLEAIEIHLGRPTGFFEDLTRDGNSVLRIIHYPPLPDDVPEGAVRAAEHEDINLLTILPASTEPGLQLMTRDGEWLEVVPPPGAMVCDTGDMMQLLTDGRLPATTHRVVNPSLDTQRSRYSMPLFCHPHPDAVLRPAREQGAIPEVTAGSFLMERLRAIGLA